MEFIELKKMVENNKTTHFFNINSINIVSILYALKCYKIIKKLMERCSSIVLVKVETISKTLFL